MEIRLVPGKETRAEIRVVNSRFIATAAPALSVAEARGFINKISDEYADASHNVPAFLIGHGSTVIAHCSDDGEPSGTAGRPVLSVLQGSGLGDVVTVVTRYFGGTKLGTGGLVRAYGDAVRAVLEILPRAAKLATVTVLVAVPYSLFEPLRLLIDIHLGRILEEDFRVDVTVTAMFSASGLTPFREALRELSGGTIEPYVVATDDHSILPLCVLGLGPDDPQGASR